MALPNDFFDDEVLYIIRMCPLVEDVNNPTPTSKVHACDSCERPIWVDEAQPIPEVEDRKVTGIVSLCLSCTAFVNSISDEEEPVLLTRADHPTLSEEDQREFFKQLMDMNASSAMPREGDNS